MKKKTEKMPPAWFDLPRKEIDKRSMEIINRRKVKMPQDLIDLLSKIDDYLIANGPKVDKNYQDHDQWPHDHEPGHPCKFFEKYPEKQDLLYCVGLLTCVTKVLMEGGEFLRTSYRMNGELNAQLMMFDILDSLT